MHNFKRKSVSFISLILAVMMGVGGVVPNVSFAAPPSGSSWNQTFGDEFTSFSWYNPATKIGTWQTTYPWGDRWDTTKCEKQYYGDQSVSVNPFSVVAGGLDIAVDRTKNGNSQGQPYTSGMISSYPSFQQTYGYFEMYAMLNEWQGFWPAFRLLPVTRGLATGINVIEVNGHDPASALFTVFSSQTSSVNWNIPNSVQVANIGTTFRLYGVDWEPDFITWYIDNQQVMQVPTPPDANVPLYMVANMAIGRCNTGDPPVTQSFPTQMVINYIHAYKKANQSTPCQLAYTNAVAVPQGYGAAYNVFSAAKELVENVDCTQPTPKLTVGSGGSNQYVYKQAYVYKGGAWQSITLTASTPLISSTWYAGTASADTPLTATDLANWNYIAAFMCTWDGSAWKCGCADSACTTGNWQLQAVKR